MEKHPKWAKFKRLIKKLIKCALNPRFVLCFGIAWMITNGWAYILLGVGAFFNIGWMTAAAGAYIAFLWLPISPEKLITIPIAIGLMRWLFPKDKETLGMLRDLSEKAKNELKLGKKHKKQTEDAKKSQPVCENKGNEHVHEHAHVHVDVFENTAEFVCPCCGTKTVEEIETKPE